MSFVGWSTSSHVKNASYFKLASNEEGVAFNPLPFLRKTIYFFVKVDIHKYACLKKQTNILLIKGIVNLTTLHF